ncbi:MAG TPA: hypothetical protein VFQ67_13600 [Allosphingosinicella sp.]|jgi:hypothetical protein|nr:hypothetical protein [Allosphingosinicella sp.]
MREPGFEELADLWQDPDGGNREAFEAQARRARRKGRLLGYVDFAFVILLIVGIVPSLLVATGPLTVATAILMLTATLWLSWTRRRHRQMAAALNTSDTAAFLESSIANARANLRRVRLSLLLMGPCVALAIVFKGSQRSHGIEDLGRGILEWASRPIAQIALVVVFLIVLGLFRSRRRLRVELSRLESLRLDYAEESGRDGGDG